ncbi:MAG TPA: sigma-70 family RNA polymerase sigma factor [Acidobacteriaceae bacterium]|jgi:RNA polymerase sigma factor (TIGR02999 family)
MDGTKENRDSADITTLLQQVRVGNAAAESDLIPLIYNELRAIARNQMGRERPDHTLQATVLVHEAFLQLVGNSQIDWQNRAHFFALASRVMRRILVDHARAARAQKRPGAREKVELESALAFAEGQYAEFLALDEALDRLSEWDPRQSRVVEMRFFGGLSFEEIAEVLGISERTAKRDWRMARAWLYRELNKTAHEDAEP